MREARGRKAEGVVDEELLRRVDHMILSADDHVYPHRVVVDDDGIVVGRHAVAFHNDDVLYRAVLVDGGVLAFYVDISVDLVVEVNMLAGLYFEEDGAVLFVGFALVQQPVGVFFIEVHTF